MGGAAGGRLARREYQLLRELAELGIPAVEVVGFRAWLEQKQGRPVSEVVAANRWLEEVWDPVVAAIPADLRDRLPPAEVFSEVLEHRWYMSEAAGRDVGTTAAAKAYFKHVLPTVPAPLDATTAA